MNNLNAKIVRVVLSFVFVVFPGCVHAQLNIAGDVTDNRVLQCDLSVPDLQLIRNRHGDMVDGRAWRQHKALKTTAWSCCGLGIASLAGSLLWTIIDYSSNGKQKNRNAESILAGAGVVLTVGSIPLFCMSHHKKSKSYRLSLNIAKMPTTAVDGSLRYGNCVGLCLNL